MTEPKKYTPPWLKDKDSDCVMFSEQLERHRYDENYLSLKKAIEESSNVIAKVVGVGGNVLYFFKKHGGAILLRPDGKTIEITPELRVCSRKIRRELNALQTWEGIRA